MIAALGLALVLTSYKAWTKPRETVWDSVPARGIPEVVISNGLQSRSWWRFGVGEPATLSIDGPTTLRIDVRPLLAGADPPDAHFVLEVQIDGQDRSWSSLTSSPSSTWNQGGVPVGKRQRIEVEVPPGHHEVTAILSAADVEACLVRFAQLDSEL